MHQPRMRCVEFVESITDWMEGELTDEDCSVIEEHMVICPHCNEFAAQLRTTVRAMRLVETTGPVRAPDAAREALLEMFRRERRAR